MYCVINGFKIPENMWTVSGDSTSTPAFGMHLFPLC